MFPRTRRSSTITAAIFAAVAIVVLSAGHAFAAEKEVVPPPLPFTGVSLKVASATVPPGGILQFQLFLTEPKPLSHASTQPTMPASSGPVRGISLNDPTGQAVGAAVIDGADVQIAVTSPDFTLGTDVAYPLLTIAAPVRADALPGTQARLDLDLGSSFFLDPLGQPYGQELAPGLFTVGGATSINDVVPGGGFVPNGGTVSILGLGFDETSKVQINEVLIASTQLISPNQIDVVLAQDAVMDARRVRVTTGAETVTYYSYLRTATVGRSFRSLLARTYPLFSRRTYSLATLPLTKSKTQFTGLAVQNASSTAAVVTLELLSSAQQVLQTVSFSLAGMSKITRDLGEFFPINFGGVAVRVTASQPVQMLGLLGDAANNTVVPVIP
jgi:hypothetical protein